MSGQLFAVLPLGTIGVDGEVAADEARDRAAAIDRMRHGEDPFPPEPAPTMYEATGSPTTVADGRSVDDVRMCAVAEHT